jgi:hypothetical protein
MSKMQNTALDSGGVGRSPARRHSEELNQDAVRRVSEEQSSFRAAAAAIKVSEKSLRPDDTERFARFREIVHPRHLCGR